MRVDDDDRDEDHDDDHYDGSLPRQRTSGAGEDYLPDPRAIL